MFEVKIAPPFGDEYLEGEYDDEEYLEAEDGMQRALRIYLHAGARSGNVEDVIENTLRDMA